MDGEQRFREVWAEMMVRPRPMATRNNVNFLAGIEQGQADAERHRLAPEAPDEFPMDEWD